MQCVGEYSGKPEETRTGRSWYNPLLLDDPVDHSVVRVQKQRSEYQR
jgi:hypothetical protein